MVQRFSALHYMRVVHYRDPAAAMFGLGQLSRQRLTPCSIVFVALDHAGEIHIAVPKNFDDVTRIRVGDKLSLEPPWEGRYFHFDTIVRLPEGGGVLWNGDRRLQQPGSAHEMAVCISEW